MSVRTLMALGLALATTAATGAAVQAQTSTREGRLHAAITYGLDEERITLQRVQRVPRIDGRRYVRTVDPGDGRMGYLILTLSVDNRRPHPAQLPTLVSTVVTNKGPALAPAVAGPFLGSARAQADPDTRIPAQSVATLYLALIDIPNDRRVTALILSPNDATAQYRFSLRPSDVTRVAPVPREAQS